MCGPARSTWLLLWTLVMLTSLTQGEVIAPSSLRAVMGLPFTLRCNVTVATGSSVKQVRWVSPHDQVLVAYKPGEPGQVFSRRRDVTLENAGRDASVITVGNAAPGDEGCYRCVFDVYPSGAQEGKTCLHIVVEVGLEGNRSAVSGKLGSLACRYALPGTVRQVLWTKAGPAAEQGGAGGGATAGGGSIVVASYARQGQPSVEEAFRGRVALSRSLGDSQLTIQPVRLEDEGCYTCSFHTFPQGARSATACLSVYVLPEPVVTYVTASPDLIQANCTARSRPPAALAWNVEGHNRTLGPALSWSRGLDDGTTLVGSTLRFHKALLDEVSVKCMVHHPGFHSPMALSLNIIVGPALAVVISVSCVAVLLLLCVCVGLCRCFIQRSD